MLTRSLWSKEILYKEYTVNVLTSNDCQWKMNYFLIISHLFHISTSDYKTLGRIKRSQRKSYTGDETFHGLRKENQTDGSETWAERTGAAAGELVNYITHLCSW